MAGLIGVRECSGHDGTKFRDIAHVNAPHGWINRENPAHGFVGLFLRSKNADKVLIVERRDDERVVRKPGFFHYPINLGLAGKVGDVELAAADSLYIRQRGPDEVFDTGILGGAYRSGRLLDLVGTLFPRISDQKYAMRPFKCSPKRFGAIQVRLDDFVGEFAMFGRIASQGAYLELIAGLKSPCDRASLFPGCADYGDEFLICAFHMQCASLSLSIDAKYIDIDTLFWTSVIQKGKIVSSWTRTRETQCTVGWYWGRPFGRPRNIFMRDLRRRESTIPTSGYLKHSSTKGLCR